MSLRNPFPKEGGEYPLGDESKKDDDAEQWLWESPNSNKNRELTYEKWPENKSKKRRSFNLPDPTEENGMGDILFGLIPDPDADPVEEINEYRR